ncbi:PQQ-binding-like beta-propeller repeat protein [Streptomyces sp. NBC_01341]|uniref:outer membrane protein assembly factor BamB family protein n=1 Tax=Streptomyces sp. NBC_01341 TaxID=2903831 RepID=UPI002E112E8F|nr:PQQ-binding-like beta-propeller repeat protein [Streptomyces sp. NBC_01341]
MTQPPGGHAPQGGFGAPYDPEQGTSPQQQPGYGYPQPQPGPYMPQPGPYMPQPGPYAPQPGPYAPQPGPYAPQQGYGYGYPPQPPTGPAPGPGGPRGGGPFKGRTGVVVGAVLAVLLLAGGGIRLAAGDGGAEEKPVTGRGGTTAGPSSSPTAHDDGEGASGPTADELNAGREPGEAEVAWLRENGVDLPEYGEETHGPWFAGDIVAKGMYRKVSGYGVADGAERWSLRLPTDLCASPTLPTADGKIVVAIEDNVSESEAECSVLQMIDLRTGRAGWKKTVDRSGLQDGLSHVAMSVSGDTVTFGRNTASDAYRVSDGSALFGKRETGVCQPYAFTGGARMLAAVSCQAQPDDPVRQQVQEVDPRTGVPKWTYDLKPGWAVAHVYSTSPVVVSIKQPEKWAVLVLNDNGTYRSRMVGDGEDYAVRCGEESVDLGGNLDGCAGAAADASRFYLATLPLPGGAKKELTNKVVAFDLAGGRPLWKAAAPAGQVMMPLRVEGGKVLVHVGAVYRTSGAIGTLEPSGGAYASLLRHPASAAETESSLFVPKVAYRDGRSFLLPQRISLDEDDEEKAATALLVFGG